MDTYDRKPHIDDVVKWRGRIWVVVAVDEFDCVELVPLRRIDMKDGRSDWVYIQAVELLREAYH